MQFRIYFYIHEAPKNDLFSVREKSKSWTVFTRYSNFHTGLRNSEAEYERHSASKFRKQVPKVGSQSRFPKGACSRATRQTCAPPTPYGSVNMQQYEKKQFHLTKQDGQQPAGFSKAPVVLHGDGIRHCGRGQKETFQDMACLEWGREVLA